MPTGILQDNDAGKSGAQTQEKSAERFHGGITADLPRWKMLPWEKREFLCAIGENGNWHSHCGKWGFLGGSEVKAPPTKAGAEKMRVQSLGREDPLEEGTATHSSILAWRATVHGIT